MLKLAITGGIVLFDKADLLLVMSRTWHVSDSGYAVWRGIDVDGVKKTIRLHRLIANTPKGLVTDHINHNRLDNRRNNLRVCTHKENMNNLTRVGKGYWYQRQNKNWVVEMGGKHRGCFVSEYEAQEFVKLVRKGLADKKPKVESTHCRWGHLLVNNVYITNNQKSCKICVKNNQRRYYKRKYAAIKLQASSREA